MVKIVILIFLFACTVWAKPFQLGINFLSSLEDLVEDPDQSDGDDDCSDETTTEKDTDSQNEIDSDATEDDPWDCSRISPNMFRCVLKSNTTHAEVLYFNSHPKNNAIPGKPPKGVAPDFTEFKIDGSLEKFMGKLEDFVDETLGAIERALTF